MLSRPTGLGCGGCLEPVFRAGESFPQRPGDYASEARVLWGSSSQAVMVALNGDGAVVGKLLPQPNCLVRLAPVANAGYVVAGPLAGCEGLGSLLCQHLALKRRPGGLGFRFHAVQPGVKVRQHRPDPFAGERIWISQKRHPAWAFRHKATVVLSCDAYGWSRASLEESQLHESLQFDSAHEKSVAVLNNPCVALLVDCAAALAGPDGRASCHLSSSSGDAHQVR